MPTPVTPFCEVTRYEGTQEGSLLDFGFAFSERPIKQFNNPLYTFTNAVIEPLTNSVLTAPKLSYVIENDSARWWFNAYSGYWTAAFPPGYPEGRRLMKWVSSNPEHHYTLLSKFSIPKKVGFVWEIGLLPSANTETDHSVELLWGGNTAKLVLSKREAASFWILDDETWKKLADVPLNLKHAWRDLETDLIWVVPYNKGLLFSSDGTDFVFIRTREGFEIEEGVLRIDGSGGVAVFGAHELELNPMVITSAPIDRAYKPMNEGEVRLHGWLPMAGTEQVEGLTTYTLNEINDTQFTYELTISPLTQVLGLSKVDVSYTPTIEVTESAGEAISVESIEEQLPEDPTQESCQIVLANQDGQYTNSFRRFDRVRWDFGWLYDDDTTVLETRNLGSIAEIDDGADDQGKRAFRMLCHSIFERIRDSSVIYAQDYEGWPPSEALADYLLGMGVPLDRQSIYEGWTDPFPAAKDGEWQPEFGGDGIKWLEDVIYYLLGGWMYMRRDGIIRIEPFPEVDDADFEEAEIFSVDDLASYHVRQPKEALNEFRNVVLVQGMTPEGYPLAQILKDQASLTNPSAANYCPYQKVLVIRGWNLSTQAIVDKTCRVCFDRYSKLRQSVDISTHPRRGSLTLAAASKLKVVHRDGSIDRVYVRSLTSHLEHAQYQQSASGHFVTEEA